MEMFSIICNLPGIAASRGFRLIPFFSYSYYFDISMFMSSVSIAKGYRKDNII